MNPLSINPVALLVGVLIVIAVGFGGGWTANGWRLNAELADAHKDRANEIATATKAALDDFKKATDTIKTASNDARVDVDGVKAELAKIRKEFKNEKPLPPDCRPDAHRVRRLTATADATDNAIAGRVSGGTVQGERPSGSGR